MSDRRFPASVFRVGSEPDVRFTLANERTFLAWVRTALALIATGVALEILGLDIHAGLRLAGSLLLVLTGAATPAFAWFGWMRAERALRSQEPLPSSPLGPFLACVLTGAGILVFLGIVLA
jgi:putative membrane protein